MSTFNSNITKWILRKIQKDYNYKCPKCIGVFKHGLFINLKTWKTFVVKWVSNSGKMEKWQLVKIWKLRSNIWEKALGMTEYETIWDKKVPWKVIDCCCTRKFSFRLKQLRSICLWHGVTGNWWYFKVLLLSKRSTTWDNLNVNWRVSNSGHI